MTDPVNQPATGNDSNEIAPNGDKLLDGTAPAGLSAAESFSPSGAARQVTDFDPEHPAIDNNPRLNTSELQNRADFNDPTIPGHTAVANALNEQGVETKDVDEALEAEDKARKSNARRTK